MKAKLLFADGFYFLVSGEFVEAAVIPLLSGVFLFLVPFWAMIFLATYLHFPNLDKRTRFKNSFFNATGLTLVIALLLFFALVFFFKALVFWLGGGFNVG